MICLNSHIGYNSEQNLLPVIDTYHFNGGLLGKHPMKYTNNNGCNSSVRVCSHCYYYSGNHCYFSICVVRVAIVYYIMPIALKRSHCSVLSGTIVAQRVIPLAYSVDTRSLILVIYIHLGRNPQNLYGIVNYTKVIYDK